MKLPLPLVFVISGKDPTGSPGGYAAYSHNLCNVLTELGYRVHIIAAGKNLATRTTSIGQLHLVPNSVASFFPVLGSVEMAMMPLYSFSFVWIIRRIIRDEHASKCVVWGIGPWAFAGTLLKANYGDKVKLLISYFTTFSHEMTRALISLRPEDYSLWLRIKYLLTIKIANLIFTMIEKFNTKRADAIVTHYRSTEKILTKELGVPEKKMERLSYYVEVFERERKPDQSLATLLKKIPRPITLTVCRQDPRKGLNYLLQAVKLLNGQGLKFSCVMVGSGPLLKANQRLAQKLQLSNVYFLGFQPEIEILYKSAQLAILPSVEEGSGSLSMLEAMRYGLPIITTNVDGIPEDVKHNVSALLVPPYNAEALAGAIEDLLGNKEKAQKLGKNAKDTYRKKFSFAKMKTDVSQLLQA